MGNCVKCSSVINAEEQHYVASDMGPDIIFVLEESLGREVDAGDQICAQCFEDIMRHMPVVSPAAMEPPNRESSPGRDNFELQNRHDTNVCVWCRISLYGRRARSLQEGVERDFVAERITPRLIPDGALICHACWVHTRRTLQEQGVLAPPLVNLHNCVWCQRSLARARRHSIPEGPERNLIVARIYPREIPIGGRLCYACWVAARRAVERSANEEQDQQAIPGPSHRHVDSTCACCQASLHRRQTHLLRSGPVRDQIAARIYPSELSDHALVCNNCWERAQENIAIEQGIPRGQPPAPEPTMSLDDCRICSLCHYL